MQKGFFPNQDTGLLMGMVRADQNISFQAMKPKVEAIAKLIQQDPAVDGVMSSIGGGAFGSRNSGTFFVRLKDYDKRSDSTTEVANRLTNKFRKEAGMQLFLMAAQDIHIGGCSANASYQYSLQADDLNLLRVWTPIVKTAVKRSC